MRHRQKSIWQPTFASPPAGRKGACDSRTAAALVNELVDAKQNNQVRRLMARWQKYELIALDEVGYVPLATSARSFCFR